MKSTVIIIILLFSYAFSGNSFAQYDLLIKNINLIDGTGAAMRENTSVLIQGEKIIDISDDIGSIEVKKTIDGKDKYLIPGLFDAHFHLLYDKHKIERSMNQLIHFGVTSILIPGGFLASYDNLKNLDSLERQNEITSPHIYYTSLISTIKGAHPMKTYGKSHYKDSVNVHIIKNDRHIEYIVEEAASHGAVALKLMVEDGPEPPFVDRISPDYIRQFAMEGKKSGLPLFTHISDMEEVNLSLNNGAKTLMHFMGVRLDWMKDMETINKIISDSISWVTTMMIGKSFFYPLNKEWMNNENFSVFGDDELAPLQDPEGIMARESRMILKNYTGNENMPVEDFLRPMMKDIDSLNELGVNIVTGTDVGGRPYILPGISLHEEMQLLQLGGMDPMDIIQATTRNAAVMLDILNDYGTIEPGKYADMVILEKNPLKDISNTLSIKYVIKHGAIQERIEMKERADFK